MIRLAVIAISTLLVGPTPQTQKPEVVPARLEKRIFERINHERVKQRLAALKVDPRLSDIARAHSEDMARHGFLSHVNPKGLDPSERARAAGYECRRRVGRTTYSGLAENIFQNNLYNRRISRGSQNIYDWNDEEDISASSVNGWMKSAGHRKNILSEKRTVTGVGVAISSDMKVYITQVFC